MSKSANSVSFSPEMILTGQEQKYLSRIHKKYPVSLEFLVLNKAEVYKYVTYSSSLHFIILRKLVRRRRNPLRHRVVVRYNCRRKYVFKQLNAKESKNTGNKIKVKRKKTKNNWSKQIARYYRKRKLPDAGEYSDSECDDNFESVNLESNQVVTSLRTQIVKMKSTYKHLNLLDSADTPRFEKSEKKVKADQNSNLIKFPTLTSLDEAPKAICKPVHNSFEVRTEHKSKNSFLDSLARKVGCAVEPKKDPIRTDSEVFETNSSEEEFHGFSESDIVSNGDVEEPPSSIWRRFKPPTHTTCSLPKKVSSLEYSIMEIEDIISRELKKRIDTNSFNPKIVRTIQNGKRAISRDCWKSMAWLRTEVGRHRFQVLEIDQRHKVQLIGGRGNYEFRYVFPQRSRIVSKAIVCPKECRFKTEFSNLHPICNDDESRPSRSKYKMLCKNYVPQPGPFSKRVHSLKQSDSELGPIEIFEMPKLELLIKLNKHLDTNSKKLLNFLTLDGNVTPEFAKFASSALQTEEKKNGCNKRDEKKFVFQMPYAKGHNHVIGCRIYKRNEAIEYPKQPLLFSKDVEKSRDENAVEVADFLGDIIDSVALSMSENSLIQLDPDLTYSNGSDELQSALPVVSPPQKKKCTQKNRLLTELRRLNATIIDAESFEDEKIECTKPHCALGCICSSLSCIPQGTVHCGKPKCMFECSCDFSFSDANMSLSNESALLLRKKATAKLARMEKEFTSTIVFTKNETLLINDRQIEKKRRCTKAPKRYDDFLDSIEEKEISPQKGKFTSPTSSSTQDNDGAVVWVDKKVLKDLKHCTVDVVQLRHVDNIVPWCMDHNVYNCACTKNPREEDEREELTFTTWPVEETPKTPAKKPRYDADIIERYVNAGLNECKRVVAIPTKAYRRRNEKHAISIRSKILSEETDKSRLLLSDRVTNSILFDIESYLRQKCAHYKSDMEALKMKQMDRKRSILSAEDSSPIVPPKKPAISAPEHRKKEEKITNDKILKIEETHITNGAENGRVPAVSPTRTIAASPPVTVPIIASVRSLSTAPITPPVFEEANMLIDKPEGQMTLEQREEYARTLEKLNDLVTKKMANIQSTQRSTLKAIAKPSKDTLYIATCRNFRASFYNDAAHVWEIVTENSKFLVVTTTMRMPIMPTALSIVNIKTFKDNPKANFMSQLLFAESEVDNTASLLMHGYESFWMVLGFIKSNQIIREDRCIKPTPSTHPWLTGKINVLYHLLKQQRAKIIPSGQKASLAVQPATSTSLALQLNMQSPPMTAPTVQSRVLHARVPQVSQLPCLIPKPAHLTSLAPQSAPLPSLTVAPKHAYAPPAVPAVDAFGAATVGSLQTEMSTFGGCWERYKATDMNIQIRNVTPLEVPTLHIPKGENVDHRWLVLDLEDDFSHIVLPFINTFITVDRIRKSLVQAKEKSKVVRLQIQNDNQFGCYATPSCSKNLYFGPFYTSSNGELQPQPRLLLIQCVDGVWLLREEFEQMRKIRREKKTSAFWVILKDKTVQFEIEEEPNDDCYIVEGTASEEKAPETNQSDLNASVSSVLILNPEDEGAAIHTNFVLMPSGNGDTYMLGAETGTVIIPPEPMSAYNMIPQIEPPALQSSTAQSPSISSIDICGEEDKTPSPQAADFSIGGTTIRKLDQKSVSLSGNPLEQIPATIIYKSSKDAPNEPNRSLLKRSLPSEEQSAVTKISRISPLRKATSTISNPSVNLQENQAGKKITGLRVRNIESMSAGSSGSVISAVNRPSAPAATPVSDNVQQMQTKPTLPLPIAGTIQMMESPKTFRSVVLNTCATNGATKPAPADHKGRLSTFMDNRLVRGGIRLSVDAAPVAKLPVANRRTDKRLMTTSSRMSLDTGAKATNIVRRSLPVQTPNGNATAKPSPSSSASTSTGVLAGARTAPIGHFCSQFQKLPTFPAKRLSSNNYLVKVSNNSRPELCTNEAQVNVLLNNTIKRICMTFDPAWAKAQWKFILNNPNASKFRAKETMQLKTPSDTDVILIDDDDD